MRKKKSSANKKVLIPLTIILIIFVFGFWLLFYKGNTIQHEFYPVYTEDENMKNYIENTALFISEDPVMNIKYEQGKYRVTDDNSIAGVAARSALESIIKGTNSLALDYYEVDPRHLLYINITERFREEIISTDSSQRNIQTISTDNFEIPDPITNEEISQEERDQIETEDTDPFETSREYVQEEQSRDRTSFDINEVPRNYQQETREGIIDIDDQLSAPQELDTYSFIFDLLFFIQIIFVLNVIAGIFGTSMFEEKINQRSTLLFMANVTRMDFIIGKILPYFIISWFSVILILFFQNSEILFKPAIYLISAILSLLYLGISCLNGLIARSSKEYSFLNVFAISGLSLYLLIPSFLANISEIGYASLLTPLLFYVQGTAIETNLIWFVVPAYLTISVLLIFLSSNAWDSEKLYQFNTPFKTILELLGNMMNKWWNFIVYGASAVAFAWLGQLVLIVMLLTFNFPGKIAVFLICAAFIEEYFRNFGLRAALMKDNDLSIKKIFIASISIGGGFLIAEKGLLIISIAPFLQGFELLILPLIIVPLLLHFGFTFSYGLLAKKGLIKNYFSSMIVFAIIHAGINYLILNATGVMLI